MDWNINCSYGLNCPFDLSNNNINIPIVVNILASHIKCFETKKWVPYKIILEIVDQAEIFKISRSVFPLE